MLDTEGIYSLCLKILLLADSEAKNNGGRTSYRPKH